MVETINKLKRITRQMSIELGRKPCDVELVWVMGVTPKKLKDVLTANKVPISIETSVNKDDNTSLADFIADEQSVAPDDNTSLTMLQADLSKLFVDLEAKEAQILRLRYGLEDGQFRTLEQVGKVFGITRERVRQIESKAIKKLREPKRFSKLQGYFDKL